MKIITKNIHDRLDNFVYENKNDKPVDDFKQEDNSSKKKLKKILIDAWKKCFNT